MPNDARMQILYYKENADVLLEFGLQGNYSMRLLTVHTDNYKDFLQQLSKAVGRNNIVLTVGGFDASDRLPEILGRAIGRELVTPSAEEFHISAQTFTRLPQDAIPLVSAEGVLAGCVVEKGLQSIIMLTGDTTVRRQVFKDLVIPYIGDRLRCITGAPPVVPQQEASPANPVPPEPPKKTEEVPNACELLPETPPITPEPESLPTPEVQKIASEPEADAPTPNAPVEPSVTDVFSSSTNMDFMLTEAEPTTTPKRTGRGARIAGTILCILLAILVTLGACGLLLYVLQQKQQETPGQKVFLYHNVCPDATEKEEFIW